MRSSFVILAGIPIGLNNTVFTGAAMEVPDAPRPVASAGYDFVRWTGGALAPYVVTKLGEEFGPAVPYCLGAACCLAGTAVLYGRRDNMRGLERVGVDHTLQDASVAA